MEKLETEHLRIKLNYQNQMKINRNKKINKDLL